MEIHPIGSDTPAALRGVHLMTVREPASRMCVSCGDGEGSLGCQRCGVLIHEDCYFKHVAAPDERARIEAAMDRNDVTLAWLCSACRS